VTTPHGYRKIVDQLAEIIAETNELGWSPDEFFVALEMATLLAQQRVTDER